MAVVLASGVLVLVAVDAQHVTSMQWAARQSISSSHHEKQNQRALQMKAVT